MEKPEKRVRRNGRLVKQKKPTSAQNAKTPIHWLVHGQQSPTFFKHPLDKRTALGKEYERTFNSLVNHLGGEDIITEPERALADQCAKYCLLADISWARLMQDGVFDEAGEVNKALESFMATTRSQRDVLRLIGLRRREKPVQDLSSYIEERKDQSSG